jgi:hypothetical protein
MKNKPQLSMYCYPTFIYRKKNAQIQTLYHLHCLALFFCIFNSDSHFFVSIHILSAAKRYCSFIRWAKLLNICICLTQKSASYPQWTIYTWLIDNNPKKLSPIYPYCYPMSMGCLNVKPLYDTALYTECGLELRYIGSMPTNHIDRQCQLMSSTEALFRITVEAAESR